MKLLLIRHPAKVAFGDWLLAIGLVTDTVRAQSLSQEIHLWLARHQQAQRGQSTGEKVPFKLFHNHLTVDLAASLFEHSSEPYLEYVRFLRVDALIRAAKAGIDLVFTFWYSSISKASAERYREVVESHGGEVLLVRLVCDEAVLEGRVQSESRKVSRAKCIEKSPIQKNCVQHSRISVMVA